MFGRDLISRCDGTPLADSIFEYCLKEACCAPLDQGAAAFAGLGLLLTASKDVSPACSQRSGNLRTLVVCMMACMHHQWPHAAILHLSIAHSMNLTTLPLALQLALGPRLTVSQMALEKGLEWPMYTAMRRREMLQRADELIPHSVGRMLLALALATSMADIDEGCRSVIEAVPAYSEHMLFHLRHTFVSATKCMLGSHLLTANDCRKGTDGLILNPQPCSFIAAATIPGALQLLRFGATLASRPTNSAWHIHNCTLLAQSHLGLLHAHPGLLGQVLHVKNRIDAFHFFGIDNS